MRAVFMPMKFHDLAPSGVPADISARQYNHHEASSALRYRCRASSARAVFTPLTAITIIHFDLIYKFGFQEAGARSSKFFRAAAV